MTRALEKVVLCIVPRPWRDAVARDLAEERPASAGIVWLALRAAEIGGRLRLARACDTVTTFQRPAWRSPMNDLPRDLSFALRSALRQPAYTLAVVATLAVGIGANTAIYSVFNWILFRPLPGVVTPDQLVTIRFQTATFRGMYFVPYPDYTYLREHLTSLSGLAVANPLAVHFSDQPGADGRRVDAEMVTPNYFDVMGATPIVGRGFLPADERTIESALPAVISHSLWRRQFNGDAGITGRPIWIDGHVFTIVGVAPPGFQGRSLLTRADVWVPVGAHRALLPHYLPDALTSRRGTFLGDAIGRLRPAVSLEAAQSEATAVAESSTEFATRAGRQKSSIRPFLFAGVGHDSVVRERMTAIFTLLMGAVALVLLLACANAGNLLLARTASRRREIAVRQAIGASRLRVIRQQLAEGLVLALAAGVAGLGLAQLLTSLFSGMRVLTFLPPIDGVQPDIRVALFTLGAALLTAGLFATIPAIAGSRVDLLPALKDGATTTRTGRPLLRAGLVVVQITVSLVLLAAAGLFIRTLHNLRSLDLGITIDHAAAFVVDPSRLGHEPQRAQQVLREVATRISAAPGIDGAALTWSAPFSNRRSEMAFATREAPETWHDAGSSAISPGFFAVMGIPIVAGRDFTEAEFGRLNTTSGVVIVSEGLAARIFPRGGALGSRLRLNYPEKMEVEVVGIVGDVRGRPVTDDPEPFAYEPGGQRWPMTWGSVVARSSLPASQMGSTARDVMRSVDARFTPPAVEPFAALFEQSLAEQRLFTRVSVVFGAVAAVLAGIGIYAMMAGAVAERRREFGIRLALGATAARLQRQVLRGATLLGFIGIVAGLGASVAARRVLESRLFGVTPLDPLTLAVTAVSILLLCGIASLVPALKAGRVDPVRSLRVE